MPATDLTRALLDITSATRMYGFEERASESPWVETVWRTPPRPALRHANPQNCRGFIFPAAHHWGLTVARAGRCTTLTLWGPGSRAAPAPPPGRADLFGVLFRPGIFMPGLSPAAFRDTRDRVLPAPTPRTFWLDGSAWQFPDFENVDTFVERLARQGVLVRDSLVDAVLADRPVDLSLRSVQRRFVQATGLTVACVRQMARARRACDLLRRGISIADTVDLAGYFDQAHLTRSLRRFIGQTPRQVARAG